MTTDNISYMTSKIQRKLNKTLSTRPEEDVLRAFGVSRTAIARVYDVTPQKLIKFLEESPNARQYKLTTNKPRNLIVECESDREFKVLDQHNNYVGSTLADTSDVYLGE